MDFIVPFTMVGVALDLAFRQFLIADFSSFLIRTFVDPRMDFQSCFRRRRGDRFDHDLQRLQRRPLPILRDVAEQTMLDLVPLARARRIT